MIVVDLDVVGNKFAANFWAEKNDFFAKIEIFTNFLLLTFFLKDPVVLVNVILCTWSLEHILTLLDFYFVQQNVHSSNIIVPCISRVHISRNLFMTIGLLKCYILKCFSIVGIKSLTQYLNIFQYWATTASQLTDH